MKKRLLQNFWEKSSMATKVLLCGEGPTDYGRQKYGSTEWEEGPVQSIIRKCVFEDIEFAYDTKNEVRKVRIQRTSAKLKGHGVKAYQLCVIASEIGDINTVSYTHLRAHETRHDLVCR